MLLAVTVDNHDVKKVVDLADPDRSLRRGRSISIESQEEWRDREIP